MKYKRIVVYHKIPDKNTTTIMVWSQNGKSFTFQYSPLLDLDTIDYILVLMGYTPFTDNDEYQFRKEYTLN